jgi:hypothetical protein
MIYREVYFHFVLPSPIVMNFAVTQLNFYTVLKIRFPASTLYSS